MNINKVIEILNNAIVTLIMIIFYHMICISFIKYNEKNIIRCMYDPVILTILTHIIVSLTEKI